MSSPDVLTLLGQCRSAILKADGDRDYMNPSNLTVQQTKAIADYISIAIHTFAVATEEIEYLTAQVDSLQDAQRGV